MEMQHQKKGTNHYERINSNKDSAILPRLGHFHFELIMQIVSAGV